MEMLRGTENSTLAFVNNAAQAWVEQDYHRKVHREIGTTPLQRMMDGASVARPAPDTATLHLAFTRKITRTPRRSDATVVVDGIRYELPAHFGHLRSVSLRSPSWDKSQMTLVDPETGGPVARLLPQDKAQNASGRRRSIQSPPKPIPTGAPKDAAAGLIAPVARRVCRHRIATGLSAQGGNHP